ncbi:16S rRNA (guanine(966)-N(2))-methyltransferase RsmD [Metamycoplasma hyosynoviae]|uniref:16S rRNA (guanine(966)-N(2))-methyltransferase RsmD n=1 Tax=Metamycoplasma hyosynoviae TaxID=29559 RepID=UPI002358697A|nr:16S rRNA (guanine(966)-N(2))-methyltransferase RsmD [Metamycoplasma hyosynoviae]MDC8918299.1 16S rRNA (guanine(966)-N(2))-methyltransferase RsmD [Metamycoplasma hyosynoviae]
MLRIIAGKYKSRRLISPSNETTRSTLDRAREGLFSSIQFDVENKIFLDLFAGSGSFCLEALSRGAKHAICIEKDHNAYEIILKNKQALGEKNLEVFNTDALSFLKKTNLQFDYIYLDPPYKITDILDDCLQLIVQKNLLKSDGIIFVETNQQFLNFANSYEILKVKKYGKIYIYYIKYRIY